MLIKKPALWLSEESWLRKASNPEQDCIAPAQKVAIKRTSNNSRNNTFFIIELTLLNYLFQLNKFRLRHS